MVENVRLGPSWLPIAEPCFLSWSLSFDERMSDRSSVTSHNQAAESVVASAILMRSRISPVAITEVAAIWRPKKAPRRTV